MKVPKQPEMNLGTVGHVDHGKTTLTKTLTGEWADRHSDELKRGISIRLGYADTAFYKCPKCNEPECYTINPKCPNCKSKCELLRAVSFVDSPGHETLMATMLSGAALMDGALLLVSANEPCPQPQTKEHLMALELANVDKIIVVQNKIDIVTHDEAKKNYEEIKEFIKGTVAETAPIIPISAHHDVNIDLLIKAIQEFIPSKEFDQKADTRMYVGRSFDINRPGTSPKDLMGGVIGGCLMQGKMSIDDDVEILPGRRVEVQGRSEREVITTTITSLFSGGSSRDFITPGGLSAIGTGLDPNLTKSDSLIGNMVGTPGTLPPVWDSFTVNCHLLERVVGYSEDLKVDKIKTMEPLMMNAGGASTVGIVTSVRDDIAETKLKIPICIDQSQRIAISRRVGGRWRLIGYGLIKN